MFMYSIHETIILETNTGVFANDIFNSVKSKHEDSNNQVEGSGFSFKLSVTCEKVNDANGSW